MYKPLKDEELPRESSGNFNEDEIGECIFEKILEPGDILYFPRGWIHQAKTVDNQHSLHITLSVYQKTSYADLFEELTKEALQKVITKSVDFRRGLPLDIWKEFGVTYADQHTDRRIAIKNRMRSMFDELIRYVNIDDAVDKIAIKFQHDALPPLIASFEKPLTAFGTQTIFENGIAKMLEIHEHTQIRLLRANIVRLTSENIIENTFRLYYYVDNSMEYHGNDLNFVELDEVASNIIKRLIKSYPEFIAIEQLSDDVEQTVSIIRSFWGRGFLMTKEPLQ